MLVHSPREQLLAAVEEVVAVEDQAWDPRGTEPRLAETASAAIPIA